MNNIMSFNPDLNQQAQEVTFSETMTKSYHSQICFRKILGIYLNEKLNFCYHVCVRSVEVIKIYVCLIIHKVRKSDLLE